MKQYFIEYSPIVILSIMLLVTIVVKYLSKYGNKYQSEQDPACKIIWNLFGIFREIQYIMLPLGMLVFSVVDFLSETNILPIFIIVYFIFKIVFIVKKIRKMKHN